MSNSIYRDLLISPPKLEVVKDAKEVVMKVISVMCDNKYTLSLKKNKEGNFKMYTHGFAYSNFQIKYDMDDIEWTADEGNWPEVFKMINTGTELIQSVKSR